MTLPSHLFVAPAIDVDTPYVSRLSARSALYTDLRLLLASTGPSLPDGGYRELVLEQNLLLRASASSRQKLWKELSTRYRLVGTDPLFVAFQDEWSRCVSEAERALTAYVLLALNDRLVADLGVLWLFERLRNGSIELRVDDVLAFLGRSVREHPEVGRWSETTTLRVAQHYLASLRDFGLARGTLRKVTVRPALYAGPVRLLVRALAMAGISDLNAVRSPLFRLVALDGAEVIHALGELNGARALRFRMQADVVELDTETAE
jgi:hypothetical protein